MFLIPPRGPREGVVFWWRPLRIGLVAIGAIFLSSATSSGGGCSEAVERFWEGGFANQRGWVLPSRPPIGWRRGTTGALRQGAMTLQNAPPRWAISWSSVQSVSPRADASHTYSASAPRSRAWMARASAAAAPFGPIVTIA